MSEPTVTRRRFSRLFAGAGLTSALAFGDEPGQGTKSVGESAPPDPQSPGPPGQAPVPEAVPPAPDEFLLAALVQLHPSDHFTPERLEGIRLGLQQNLARGQVLRRVPLLNSDAPATMFRVFRAEDGERPISP